MLRAAEPLRAPGRMKRLVGAAARVASQVFGAAEEEGSCHCSCIRCGEAIAFEPERPLCPACYRAWARYANPGYAEPYCHGCGEKKRTSLARPLCSACYQRAA